jgi:hypothetical protein
VRVVSERICERCGTKNPETGLSDDVWCSKCGNFLGFSDHSKAPQQRREIRVVISRTPDEVVPGEEAELFLKVANLSTIVESISLSVEGDLAPWSTAEPVVVGLFPKQDAEVRIAIRPPRSPVVRAGPTPIHVRGVSQSDPMVSDTSDTMLNVLSFVEVHGQLTPQQSAGPAGGEHRLIVENASNVALDVPITASEPGDRLSFSLDRSSVSLQPGGTTDVALRVVPREALEEPTDKHHHFTIKLEPRGAPTTIKGVHIQEAALTVPTLALGESAIHAAPGQEVATALTVRNRGRGGETYALTVLGPAAGWAHVSPPTVVLPSGGEVVAKVVFIPPSAPPAPGATVPFAVKGTSQADTTRSVVTEGALTVDPVRALSLEVLGASGRGRWSGRYVSRVENHGNAVLDVRPVVAEPERRLSFAVNPPSVAVSPGSGALVAVKARPRHPSVLGKPVDHSFQLSVFPASNGNRVSGADPLAQRELTFHQISVLPRLLTFLVVLVALIAGGAAVAAAILPSMFG